MIKITIQQDNEDPLVFEFEQYKFLVENGIERILNGNDTIITTHNGSSRILIQAWTGCQCYNSLHTAHISI